MDGNFNNNDVVTNYEEPKAAGTILGKLSFIFGIICLALALAGTILSLTLNVGSSVMQYMNR